MKFIIVIVPFEKLVDVFSFYKKKGIFVIDTLFYSYSRLNQT